jgi:CHASE1-domain containing sensor protein
MVRECHAAGRTRRPVIATFFVGQWEYRAAMTRFDSAAEAQALALSNGIQDCIARLQTLRTLFESSNDEVSRSEFEVFAKRLFEGRTKVVRAGWMPRVKARERHEFENAARADGVPNFRIKPFSGDHGLASGDNAEYLPVFFSTMRRTYRGSRRCSARATTTASRCSPPG